MMASKTGQQKAAMNERPKAWIKTLALEINS